jgi:hypothetical protein
MAAGSLQVPWPGETGEWSVTPGATGPPREADPAKDFNGWAPPAVESGSAQMSFDYEGAFTSMI